MSDLLVLHGALGSVAQQKHLTDALQAHFSVHTLNFSGHGGEGFADDFGIAQFADEVSRWISKNQKEGIDVLGYSMGGYVASYLAKQQPELIGKIVTLGTKWQWDPETSAREVQLLDADAIEAKVPKFAAALASRHQPEDWKEVLQKTATMMVAMGQEPPLTTDDLAGVKNAVLVTLGDRDRMVSLPETYAAYQALPNAQFAVWPNTPHPIEKVDPETLIAPIVRFLGR